MNGVKKHIMSAAVAGACATLEGAAARAQDAQIVVPKPEQERRIAKRRLTVDIRVEAEAGDDSPLGPLVAEALAEFINSEANSKTSGAFESAAGLDVKWRACNQFFDRNGVLMASDAGSDQHPVPVGIATINGHGDVLRIRGVNFGMGLFSILADPDPATTWRISKKDGVITFEKVNGTEEAR